LHRANKNWKKKKSHKSKNQYKDNIRYLDSFWRNKDAKKEDAVMVKKGAENLYPTAENKKRKTEHRLF